LAERELKTPFLGEETDTELLEAALEYLKDERDLRGFDEKKGWDSCDAHTADLIAALAAASVIYGSGPGEVCGGGGAEIGDGGRDFFVWGGRTGWRMRWRDGGRADLCDRI